MVERRKKQRIPGNLQNLFKLLVEILLKVEESESISNNFCV
jgi:hypothetical protein